MLNIQGGMNLKQNNRFIMAMYRLGHLNYQELVPQLSKTETIIFHCMIESDDGCVVDPKKDTNYGRIKMSVLAKKIDISTQSLSRMIKGLEEKGYLKREVDESDRRNTYVLFTEKGKTLSEEMHDKYKKLFHNLKSVLNHGASASSSSNLTSFERSVSWRKRAYTRLARTFIIG